MAAGQKKKPVLTPAARVAAVIVALGKEEAAEVYKFLKEEEIETISLEVAKLHNVSQEDLQEIVDDFYGLCVTQKVIAEGGVIYARDVLEKAFGPEQARDYMERISQAMQTRPFDFVRKTNYRSLMMIIQNEMPQTIAFILSYAKADQSSKIISELPRDIQLEVVRRIACLESVSPEIVSLVEQVMERRCSSIVSQDFTEIGGVNYVADIMNHTDRATEKHIFEELNKTDPELSENIRKLMFVFEDITILDDMSIQRVLRDVDTQDLAVAIKGSNEEVKNTLLANMSTRARENLLSDIEYLRNVRMRDVEEAQQRIVGVVRALEETGEIVISRGEEDEIIA